MCIVIRKPNVTAGLKCAIEIVPNKYTPIVTPTKGTNVIKEIPNIPFNRASITTEPVAISTTIKVPLTSAINFF